MIPFSFTDHLIPVSRYGAAGIFYWRLVDWPRKGSEMVRSKCLVWAVAIAGAAGSVAMAAVVPVGTGGSQAELYVEFADGAAYSFQVAFDGPMTGMGLFDAVEAATGMTTMRVFEGAFIDAVTYDGHSNSGFGGGENWWHYWIREPGGPWTMSFISATDRIVSDGTGDAWIYGHALPPVPEPATALLACAGMVLVLPNRRRRP